MKLLKNIMIVAFVVLTIDGCIHRDPLVQLSNGYDIGAISWSSPCSLNYVPSNDQRTYSHFRAVAEIETNTNEACYGLTSPGEDLTFDDELMWQDAIRQHNASPDASWLQVENVQSFAADEHHIIGEYGSGHFLVDIAVNRLQKFADVEEWRTAVTELTTLSPSDLKDPKSLLAQSRHPAVLTCYALILVMALITGLLKQPKLGSPAGGPGRDRDKTIHTRISTIRK